VDVPEWSSEVCNENSFDRNRIKHAIVLHLNRYHRSHFGSRYQFVACYPQSVFVSFPTDSGPLVIPFLQLLNAPAHTLFRMLHTMLQLTHYFAGSSLVARAPT
jgi:hypothetical protein